MNATEQTVQRKTTVVPYKFQMYPMDLFKFDGSSRKVNSEVEHQAALADGFFENPPAIQASVAVAPMTTAPAIQSAYDALKKELEGKTAEFNLKYAKLQVQYEAEAKKLYSLREEHRALTAEYEAFRNQKPEPQPDFPPTDEPTTVDELLNEAPENPFANMPAEAAPVSRLAALAKDPIAKKGRAKDA
jgi:hypothetical protein